MKEEYLKKYWALDDEKPHPNSTHEWWCIEAFLKTEKNKKFSLRSYLWQWNESPKNKGSLLIITLLDQQTGKHYSYNVKKSEKLEISDDELYVSFDDSFIKGTHPKYSMKFSDKKNYITFDLEYVAESCPRWVSQDITDGWLPMGIGFFRFGFNPKCKVSGKMNFKQKEYSLKGTGYFEHVWGNYSYTNPLSSKNSLKKTLKTYARLARWWLKQNNAKIPKSLIFATENNPFGNDWCWAVLDNGWTLFYGNIMFWLMKGPALGTLILSKDGKNFTEFGNIKFKYNKTKHNKTYDFFYPTEIEITAKKGKEKLHLIFDMNQNFSESLDIFSEDKKWTSLVVCENPGKLKGEYFNKNQEEKLSGICKLEMQRQLSKSGHNSIQFDFLIPPEGFGIDTKINSHYFKKKIKLKLYLLPKPSFKFKSKKISEKEWSIL